jgi:hypothetical protein
MKGQHGCFLQSLLALSFYDSVAVEEQLLPPKVHQHALPLIAPHAFSSLLVDCASVAPCLQGTNTMAHI